MLNILIILITILIAGLFITTANAEPTNTTTCSFGNVTIMGLKNATLQEFYCNPDDSIHNYPGMGPKPPSVCGGIGTDCGN